MDWQSQVLKLRCGGICVALWLVGMVTGQAQALDRYGWAFDVPFSIYGRSVTGPDGSVYVGGSVADFRFRDVTYRSTTGEDAVVLKLRPSGGLDWVVRLGGSADGEADFLSFDADGRLNVYGSDGGTSRRWVLDAAGQTLGTFEETGNRYRVPLDSGPGFIEPSSSGFRVLDAQGGFVWSRKTHTLTVRAVRELADGTVIAIGEGGTQGRIGKNGRIPDSDEEWVDIRGPVMARFASDGALLWAQSATDPVRVFTRSDAAIIDEQGNALLGGTFTNALLLGGRRLETGAGEGSFLSNAFLVNWDASGTVRWVKQVASDTGSNVHWITVASNNTIYVAGAFDDSVSIDGRSFREDPVDPFRWTGAYVLALQADGTTVGANGLNIMEPGLLVSPSGEVYLRGVVDGERQFGIWPSGGGRFPTWFVARLGDLGPTIAEQPESVIISDQSFPHFDVLVTGSEPFEIQWRKDGAPLEESDVYVGVNESELSVRQKGRENAGSYDVVVTSGATSVTSRAATVNFENAPPIFTTGDRVSLTFNQVEEELIHRVPLAVEDPDGDQSFNWVINQNLRFRSDADPVEVTLAAATGVGNELIIRWPPPNGRRFPRRNYVGTVVVTDPAGAAAELPVQVFFNGRLPTRLDLQRSSLLLDEDAQQVVFTGVTSDPNTHPDIINPETLEWRAFVQPEALGVATVTVVERAPFETEPELEIGFTPAPDVNGTGQVVLEVQGTLSPDPIQFIIPLTVRPVNDAPRLLSPLSLGQEVAVGSVVRGDIGQWFDPETDLVGLRFAIQWVVNDSPSAEGAQEITGAITEELLVSDALLGRYIALRVSVTDALVPGEPDRRETTVAFSEFRQVGRATMPIPDFNQVPTTTVSGGYRFLNGGRPDAFAGDWVRDGRRLINLRDPELSFNIGDRVASPFSHQDRDWLGFFAFGYNSDWIGMVGSSAQSWVFDAQMVFSAEQRVFSGDAEFTFFTGSGSNFNGDFVGLLVTPEGEAYRVTRSPVSERVFVDRIGGDREGSMEGLATIRSHPETTHVMAITSSVTSSGTLSTVSSRLFPSLEFVNEITLPIRVENRQIGDEWGISRDGLWGLVQSSEASVGQKRLILLDFETGSVVRDLLLDAENDFVVSRPAGDRDQVLTQGPRTVSVEGQDCFIIERNTEGEEVALIDFVSWKTGRVVRSNWVERGMFRNGDFYHPDRPGHFLYPSGLSTDLLVYDFSTGEIIERLPLPLALLGDVNEPFTHVRTRADGRLILLSNRRGHFAAFHPLAKGEVQGVVFEDSNENGQLDFGLIQSESPHIVYVIDVSGSVGAGFVGSAVGDVNLDGDANTILDAELAAFGSFHRNLIRFGQADDARVAVVGFSGEARSFNSEGVVSPSGALIGGLEDTDGDLVPDILQALRRVRLSVDGLGGGTDFFAGLALARDIFGAAGTAPEQANIIFLSDGEASDNFQDLSNELKGLGVNIRAIGVGRDSSLSTLRRMDPDAIQVGSSDELIAAFEPQEALLEGISVYADFDASGSLNGEEPSTTTASDNVFTSLIESGDYGFRSISSGMYPIRANVANFEPTVDLVADVRPVVPTIHLIPLRSVVAQVEPPSIAIQPVGGEWEVGQTARLSVFAVGQGLQFQWLRNGVELTGQTSNTLTLSNLQLTDTGNYAARVTNAGGSLESAAVVVSVVSPAPVVAPIEIVVSPVGGEFEPGNSAALFVVATGGEPLAYQWRKDGVNLAGEDGSVLLLVGIGPDQTGVYDVVVSNPAGQVVSASATVTLNSVLPPLPPVGPTRPTLRWDRATGAVVVTGVSGSSYVIEATRDPAAGPWVPVTTVTLDSEEGMWVDPVGGLLPERFYRARLLP